MKSKVFKFILTLKILSWSGLVVAENALDELLKKYESTSKVETRAKPESAREPASSTQAKPMTVKKKKESEAATISPSEPTAAPVKTPEEEEQEPALLGDWAGAKSKMKKAGVEVALYYKSTTMSVMSGGLKRGTHSFGNVDLTTDLDFEKLIGAKGLSLSLYGLGNHGGKPSEFVGNDAGVGAEHIQAIRSVFKATSRRSVYAVDGAARLQCRLFFNGVI